MAGGGKQRLESLKLRLWSYSKLLIMTRYKVGAQESGTKWKSEQRARSMKEWRTENKAGGTSDLTAFTGLVSACHRADTG